MTGTVTADLEATISLHIFSTDGVLNESWGVIDTGFNGYLTAPPQTIVRLNLPICGHTEAQLGDGSCVQMPTYAATIEWFGRQIEVPVLASKSGMLIGMSLLRGLRICMDVDPEGVVELTERS